LLLTFRALAQRQALLYAPDVMHEHDLLLALAARGLDASGRRAVFDALIRRRGLVLDELAARRRVLSSVHDPVLDSLVEQFRSRSERVASLAVRAAMDPHERQRLEQARSEEARVEEVLARSVALRGGEAEGRIGFVHVRSALPDGSALVAYARY